MTTDRSTTIHSLLTEAFAPSQLQVTDQSHLHAGHEGAKDGKGHFEVTIVSDRFSNRNRISRHRMVFEALGSLMETDIHALQIKAYAPDERQN